jgi:hypothetical protein
LQQPAFATESISFRAGIWHGVFRIFVDKKRLMTAATGDEHRRQLVAFKGPVRAIMFLF